jgi:uncharacterized protein YjbI with pentapeptide repeats
MVIELLEKTQENHSDAYQLIQDEQLASLPITTQTLAGSRVLKSTYHNMVFSDCVFYAVEFQDVTFDNCLFINCTFKFSHIKSCILNLCHFQNCKWEACSSRDSLYIDCELDATLSRLTETNGNELSFNIQGPYLMAA